MKSKFPVVNDLERLLTAINTEAALDVAKHKRAAKRAETVTKDMRKQRDAALGKAAEYRSNVARYRRELIAARTEIKQLRKEQSNA